MHVEDPAMLPWMIGLMWVPALASVITRLVLREGFRDVSFRVGGRPGVRAIGLAFVAPVLVGLVAYGIAWVTGLAQFVPPAGGWFAGMAPAALRFAISVIVSMLVGGIVGIVTAAGEEIGWRGYMVTRLVQAGVPAPLVVSGLIWGLWHVPAILTGQYGAGPYPLLSAVFFLIFAVGISAFWGTLRLRTGSVWSAIFGHAAWNAVIEGPFTGYTAGAGDALWVGESGILVVLAVCTLGYVTWKLTSPK
jgi:membrane protease YdiL (CAAX protease family)